MLSPMPHPCFIFTLHNRYGLYAWRVEVMRDHQLHSKLFVLADYDSPEQAREQAEAYRNALIVRLPAAPSYASRQRLLPHNTSGYPGVGRIESNNQIYWRANTRLHGFNLTRSFSVRRYGEEQAKFLAIKEREYQLSLSNVPYEEALETLQRKYAKTNSRIREHRIQLALNKPISSRPADELLRRSQLAQPLEISHDQANLSITRHFAASARLHADRLLADSAG